MPPMYDVRFNTFRPGEGSSRAVRRGMLVVMIYDAYRRSYQSIKAFSLLINLFPNAFTVERALGQTH